jgi:hypothetical protein
METVGGFYGIDPDEVEVVQMTARGPVRGRDVRVHRAREAGNAGLRFDLSRARIEEFLPDTIST